jgi:peptidoglycan/LPS O-acetylase OafA/YrhL
MPTPGQRKGGGHESFRQEIQGLRAVAVGLVVLFHLWPLRLSGGYVGVDVFFVISGYLITSHIFREVAQTGTLRVARFWARRVRRLLPASLLVLALSAVGVLLWAPVTLWEQSARQVAASALYVQNWALALDAVDYMALDNVPTVAQHYWSLSVEEQFYAVWPLLILGLLWLLGRRLGNRPATVEQRRRVILVGLGILALASLVWSGLSTAQDQAFAYMSTLTRVWEFAAGAITALVTVRLSRTAAGFTGWLGVLAIVVAGVVFTERSLFPGWIALLPVLGTVAVILAGQGGRATAGWWLARRPATFIGDISYSVYLVHWPLIVLVPYATGHRLLWSEKLAILAATVLLAWLSKTYVEDPLRVRPLLAARPWRAFAFAATGMLVFVAANVGLNAELDRREAASAAVAAAQLESGDRCLGPAVLDPANGCGVVEGVGAPITPPEVVLQQNKQSIYRQCQRVMGVGDLITCELGEKTAPSRTVAFVGDSHAGALAPLMDQLGKDLGWRVVGHTKGSCPTSDASRVLPSETSDERQRLCDEFNAEVDEAILRDPAITDVFVTAFSSAYDWKSPAGHTFANPAVEGYQSMWRRWTAAGKRVHVIRDVPGTDGKVIPSCLSLAGDDPERCATPRSTALVADDAVAAATALKDPKVTVIDLTPQFCDAETCYAQLGNVIVYRDSSHLSMEFARLLAPYVARQLEPRPTPTS